MLDQRLVALKNLKNMGLKPKRQKVIIVGAAVATLVATGGGTPTPTSSSSTVKQGDVQGEPSSGNDILILGGGTGAAGIVATGAGEDKVTGGAAADVISGGAGKDEILGGAGLDLLAVIGVTKDGVVTEAELKALAGGNVNFSDLFDLNDLNDHAQSDVVAGEIIDGGVDLAVLYTFGDVDFTDVKLANLAKIYIDGVVILSNASLQDLKAEGLAEIFGEGVIQAQSGQLDLDGLIVPASVVIKDSDGNVIVPTPSDASIKVEVDIVENSTSVGVFNVSDASAVGDVTYVLDGVDKELFEIDATTGEITFKAAPDFENAQDDGKDNVYNVSVIATDQHTSASHDIAIKVTDVLVNNEGVVTIAGDATQSQTLTASVADIDGLDGAVLKYSWQRDGQTFGVSGATYKLNQIDVGAKISVKVTYTDAEGFEESLTSAETDAVANVNDVGFLSIFGTATQGELLIAEVGDIDKITAFNFDFQWFRDGAPIVGGTASTYTPTHDDVGAKISVNAKFVDAFGFNEDLTSDVTDVVTNINDTGELSIGGDWVEGITLTSSLVDLDGLVGVNVSYQWQRDGVNIGGANDATYTLGQADVGAAIRLTASYTDQFGAEESLNSDATGAIINVNNAGFMALTGEAKMGETLTASVTDIDGLDGVDISYQWYGNGVAFVGATNATLALADAHMGAVMSVRATYTDQGGSVESVESGNTEAVHIGETYSLYAVNGANGFAVSGEEVLERFGVDVASAGDVNADGFDDFIVGANETFYGADGAGSAYVVFGRGEGFDAEWTVADLDGTNGFRVDSPYEFDGLGRAVSGIGDIDGDGFDDVIMSSRGRGANQTGESHIVYGHAGAFDAVIGIDSFAITDDYTRRVDSTEVNDKSIGFDVSAAGDVNGDGIDDFLVGANQSDVNGEGAAGKVFVVFGGGKIFNSYDLATLDGTNGFEVVGFEDNANVGGAIAGLGDLNGDGFDDLVVGVSTKDVVDPDNSPINRGGASMIIYGKADFSGDATITTEQFNEFGFATFGVNALDGNGSAVSSAGDFNGDGYNDLIVNSLRADNGGNVNSGSVYLVYGKAEQISGIKFLSELDVSDGFRIDGEEAGQQAGFSISSAGDVNGDGFDDLLIGSLGILGAGSKTYVVFGNDQQVNPVMRLADLDGSDGFELTAGEGDSFGLTVSGAGDLNGDGYADIVMGVKNININLGAGPGISYVVYGGAHFAATASAATAGDDQVTGTENADTLNAGAGNDNIMALAGEDIIIAGHGGDVINSGADADRIWGGGGADTFKFAAGDSALTIADAGDAGTISGYDVIYDFEVGTVNTLSEVYEFAGGGSIVADIGSDDGVDSTLTIGGEVIKSHAIDDGVISFSKSDLFGLVFDIGVEGEIAAAVQYLQLQNFGAAGATVAFDRGGDTFLYTQGSADGVDDSLDVLVLLEDVQVDDLITENAVGAFDLFIA